MVTPPPVRPGLQVGEIALGVVVVTEGICAISQRFSGNAAVGVATRGGGAGLWVGERLQLAIRPIGKLEDLAIGVGFIKNPPGDVAHELIGLAKGIE